MNEFLRSRWDFPLSAEDPVRAGDVRSGAGRAVRPGLPGLCSTALPPLAPLAPQSILPSCGVYVHRPCLLATLGRHPPRFPLLCCHSSCAQCPPRSPTCSAVACTCTDAACLPCSPSTLLPCPPPPASLALFPPQSILLSFGMYTDYAWVWGGLGFLFGMYLLLAALTCAAFAITPVRRRAAAARRHRRLRYRCCWHWRHLHCCPAAAVPRRLGHRPGAPPPPAQPAKTAAARSQLRRWCPADAGAAGASRADAPKLGRPPAGPQQGRLAGVGPSCTAPFSTEPLVVLPCTVQDPKKVATVAEAEPRARDGAEVAEAGTAGPAPPPPRADSRGAELSKLEGPASGGSDGKAGSGGGGGGGGLSAALDVPFTPMTLAFRWVGRGGWRASWPGGAGLQQGLPGRGHRGRPSPVPAPAQALGGPVHSPCLRRAPPPPAHASEHSLFRRPACRNICYFVNKPSWSSAPESEQHPGMIQLLHVSGGLGWVHSWCRQQPRAGSAGVIQLPRASREPAALGLQALLGGLRMGGSAWHPHTRGWPRGSAAAAHTETRLRPSPCARRT